MAFYLLGPAILISWIRNLKLLVPFSTIANAATILSFVLIFRYVFDGLPSLADRQPVGTIQGIPLFFGTVLFAMEAIGMVSASTYAQNLIYLYDTICSIGTYLIYYRF